MKALEKDELFQNLSGFLKTKGIELREGSYAGRIRKSCALLSDAVNLGQEGFERAKGKIDTKLDQMRQVIHEKTAPKGAKTPPTEAAPPPVNEPQPQAEPAKTQAGKKTKRPSNPKPEATSKPKTRRSSGTSKPKGK
ncbi:MAG TPA: hypothetical protein VEC99_12660 [Clostridia bacterium]|nr:hypothetical protein [Clostridia bacterium]